jgi:hypothetical protein
MIVGSNPAPPGGRERPTERAVCRLPPHRPEAPPAALSAAGNGRTQAGSRRAILQGADDRYGLDGCGDLLKTEIAARVAIVAAHRKLQVAVLEAAET